ncbi:MAG: aminopeptidase P family protein [Burkholderiaceae bacterium]|nr:MAG: aminopeptidase P family protein [Burkholderiaceae bacterium]
MAQSSYVSCLNIVKPDFNTITQFRQVQEAAKTVLRNLPAQLDMNDTEASIAAKAVAMLAELGYHETWYYDCPAQVLLGSRSCLSISGRFYTPSNEVIGGKNLVSVDLSPRFGDIWGDFSRTFAFEFGAWVPQAKSREYINGFQFQHYIHEQLVQWLKPHHSFHQLFEWANVRIREKGFVNLDFRSNVGHSIATQREDRHFIQADDHTPLGDVAFFSFEPFVRVKGGHWGFKHEDIYYFDDKDRLQCL